MPGAEYVRLCGCGCSRPLRDKNGDPDFGRFFFNNDCKARDKAARTALRRLHQEKRVERRKTCPTCKRTKKRIWLIVIRPDGRRVRVGVLNDKTAQQIIAASRMPDPAALTLAIIPTPKQPAQVKIARRKVAR